MSVSTITIFMNPNCKSHPIFRETITFGESWLHDKRRQDLLGWVECNSVYNYSEAYDEDTEEVIENSSLIKECNSEEEAIKYAKEWFGVKEIFTAEGRRIAV